jgi:hypothetical protein
MRLSGPRPGATRQERADILRRERAAALTMRASFPAVQQVRLEMQFEGTSNTPAAQTHILHPPARAFFDFPCPYADCDGHFDLNQAVSSALSMSACQTVGILGCAGLRSRDHASKQPCELRLSYRIIATY